MWYVPTSIPKIHWSLSPYTSWSGEGGTKAWALLSKTSAATSKAPARSVAVADKPSFCRSSLSNGSLKLGRSISSKRLSHSLSSASPRSVASAKAVNLCSRGSRGSGMSGSGWDRCKPGVDKCSARLAKAFNWSMAAASAADSRSREAKKSAELRGSSSATDSLILWW